MFIIFYFRSFENMMDVLNVLSPARILDLSYTSHTPLSQKLREICISFSSFITSGCVLPEQKSSEMFLFSGEDLELFEWL